MGNSESSLSEYEYHFDNPIFGDFDFSEVQVYVIRDYESFYAAKKFLENAKVLYVDCEGQCFGSAAQRLGTVQVATGPNCCLVFHISQYRESLDFLKNLFESDEVRKVFHDCSGDSAVLFHENGILLTSKSVDDTQIAHKIIESTLYRTPINPSSGSSLANLYKIYCKKNIPGNKRINDNFDGVPGGNKWIDYEELTPGMIKYAVMDVLAIYEIFTIQRRYLKRNRQYRQYKTLVQRQLEIKRRYDESDSDVDNQCGCVIS